MHTLEDRDLHSIEVDSPEHGFVLLNVLAEVKSFLAHAGRCPLIIALVGVVVDELRRPVKLLNELADCGSLEDFIQRGWEAAVAGACRLTSFCTTVYPSPLRMQRIAAAMLLRRAQLPVVC
jgi:hypothetical protein